ncbi:hypothetical protein, partial [Klebsiella pneumoniae]|uniref:hypothetical protein n=1 Tax=Klebsiella pneumoniae TaxID=573 RepID=UPI001BDF8876
MQFSYMAPPRASSSNAKLKQKIGSDSSSKRRKQSGRDTNEFVSEDAAAKHEGEIVYRSMVHCKPVPKDFIASCIPMLHEKLT